MRRLFVSVTAVAVLVVATAPASAFWVRHPHPFHRVQGMPGMPIQGVQAQGIWSDLAMAILPSLLNQFHFQLPPLLGGGGANNGGAGTATPVPTRVVDKLNELDSKLDDVLERSTALLKMGPGANDVQGRKRSPSR